MAKKRKKEEVSEIFVQALVQVGAKYGQDEYVSEMYKVGIKARQIPAAALDFAMDNMPKEYDRLTTAEQFEVERRLKEYFKRLLS